MAKYDLIVQGFGMAREADPEPITIETKSANVAEEDVKDILNSFVKHQNVKARFRLGDFVVEKVIKKHL